MVSLNEAPAQPRAGFQTETRGGRLLVRFRGDWVTAEAEFLDRQLRDLDLTDASEIDLDASAVRRMDSAGAWLLIRLKRRAEKDGKRVSGPKIPENFSPLIELLDKVHSAPPVSHHPRPTLDFIFYRVGRGSVNLYKTAGEMLSYLGVVTVETVETVFTKQRLRWISLINQIDETGITALPILGLLSFLIGVVIAYQGADQLARFGAEILTVNLVGVSILREIGVLMTAIIVAGRSGSAFTAHIGTMKVNQEVDAMETIGLNIVEVLVLPRLLALVIVMPFLTLYADLMGILGGAVMCYFTLDITLSVFFDQLQSAIDVNQLAVGLIKAPAFAFIIALVGCFEGLKVEGNAASVGHSTTRSVVESIFLVIIVDAGFSILFQILGI